MQLDTTPQLVAPSCRLSTWRKDHLNLLSRLQLPILLNRLELYGDGLELGVLKGEFSKSLLSNSSLSVLYSVDPWKEFGKDEYVDSNALSHEKHEKNYQITKEVLAPFGDRSKILRMTSEEALVEIPQSSLDFVYIDANHEYEHVKYDLVNWAEKVRVGGIIAGHDYLDDGTYYDIEGKGFTSDLNDPEVKEGCSIIRFGVKGAVDKYVLEHAYTLHLTGETLIPSWFFIKTH